MITKSGGSAASENLVLSGAKYKSVKDVKFGAIELANTPNFRAEKVYTVKVFLYVRYCTRFSNHIDEP